MPDTKTRLLPVAVAIVCAVLFLLAVWAFRVVEGTHLGEPHTESRCADTQHARWLPDTRCPGDM